MKSVVWVGVALAVTFGIGWQSSRLVAHDGTPSEHGRGNRGGERSRRFEGPLGPPQHFLDELGLDDAQRARIDTLIAESAAAMDAHEDSMRELMDRTREQVLAVLTAQQRERLDAMIEEVFAKRRRERVESDLAWFAKNTALSSTALADVERVLTDYENGKSALFQPKCADGKPSNLRPDDAAIDAAIDALRRTRDERMGAIVDAPTLERFRTESSRSRRGFGGPSGGPPRGAPSDHHVPDHHAKESPR
ncbi:MAG: hypothetical protein IPH13_09480 [Planctomycetes bacterium]|nr:hypothetical protein [Planctomycetota bacterium]